MIFAAKQAITIRWRVILDARVMSGRHFVAAQRLREFIQRGELQARIAGDARNRRFAVQVTLNERFNDRFIKLLFEIQHVKRKAERFGDAARVIHVVERAAAAGKRIAVFVNIDVTALIPQLHRKADELVTLFFEERSG